MVPVYHGQFRVVQPDVVLADIAAQVAAGAQHITFGDPDFFNGPTHAMRIVDAMHAAHPGLTYDVTIKVEHLLQHRPLLPRLRGSGCLFVTSAVESLDDRVLAFLDKGHTRADFLEAVAACRAAGVTLVPTFVAFHPWLDARRTIAICSTRSRSSTSSSTSRRSSWRSGCWSPKAPGCSSFRSCAPSRDAFDPATLAYPWTHADPRVDALHRDVTALVGTRQTTDRRASFDEIRALAHERAGLPRPNPVARVCRQCRT